VRPLGGVDSMSASFGSTFPTRRSYAVVGLAFMAFAVYGSLLPFEFRPIPFGTALSTFSSVVLTRPPSRISRSDLLANALLFIPVGYALAGALLLGRAGGWRTLRAAVTIVPISLSVSLVAEFLQLFAGNRVPSNTDIAAQLVGCLAGIAAWMLVGERFTVWLRETCAAKTDDRLARVLAGFAIGWVFVNLAPFDITVDAGDLAARLRSGKISVVPFSGAGVASARWTWDALAELLSAIPLGVFGLIGWKSKGLHRPATAFAVGLAIVLCVELAQVFISSHAASGTNVIFGAIGVALGVSLGHRFLSKHREPDDGPATRLIDPRALALLFLWIVVLCAYHWMPYDFGVDTEAIRRKAGRISLLPFDGYRSGSYLNALNNLLTKVALALPFGLVAAFVVRPTARMRGVITAAWVLFGAAVFGAIEVGQFFLPRRHPDPTDVLVGALAAYGGLRLGYWLAGTRERLTPPSSSSETARLRENDDVAGERPR
jgi:VanZ family protein